MPKSTRARCITSGQGLVIGGETTYDYYGCMIPRPRDGSKGFSYRFDSIHAYDGKGRSGSGPYFHASSFELPPNQFVLTSDGMVRPFSGCFPRSLEEAGISKPDGKNFYFSVFAGSRCYHFWIPNKYNWNSRVPVPLNCWYYDFFDCYTINGIFYYTSRIEQWTCYQKFPVTTPVSTLYRVMMSSHEVVQSKVRYYSQLPRYALWAEPRVELSIYEANAYFDFTHNEREAYEGWKLGMSLGDYQLLPNYYRSGFSSAFINALDDVPQSGLNGAELILDILDALQSLKNPIKALRELKPKGLPKASEVWLKYRYVFSTTKMDVEDVRNLYYRIEELKSRLSPIKIRGTYRHSDGSLFRFKASMNPDREFLEKLDSIPGYLGEASWTDLWDLIPWSFMIDWFAHVSDLLEYMEKWGGAIEARYPLSDVWYSVETSTAGQLVYFRIPGDPNHPMMGSPFLSIRRASTKSLAMRATDCLAIFGRR